MPEGVAQAISKDGFNLQNHDEDDYADKNSNKASTHRYNHSDDHTSSTLCHSISLYHNHVHR